jgi:hypothetical protein
MSGGLLCCGCIALSYNSRLPIEKNVGLHRSAGVAALNELAWTIAMSRTHLFRISCTHEWALAGARCRNPGQQKNACRPETNDAIELYIGFLLIKPWPPVDSALDMVHDQDVEQRWAGFHCPPQSV